MPHKIHLCIINISLNVEHVPTGAIVYSRSVFDCSFRIASTNSSAASFETCLAEYQPCPPNPNALPPGGIHHAVFRTLHNPHRR